MSFFSPNRFILRAPKSLAYEEEISTNPCEIPSEAQVRHESMLINEVSLILAEKRTALSVLRTGLAVLILPLSVVSVLVAVSRLYDPAKVMYLLAPLLGISVLLAFFGLYLIYRSFKKTLSLDRLSLELKKQNPQLRLLAQLMEPGFGADPYDDLAKQLEPASPIETIPPANQPAKQPPEPSTP